MQLVSQKRNGKTSESGFSLIAMAVALALLALGAATMLGKQARDQQWSPRVHTKESLKVLQAALSNFQMQHHRLPCPADPALRPSDPNYGIESAEVVGFNQTNLTQYPGSVNCVVDQTSIRATEDQTSASAALVGAIPFKTLGLSEKALADGWLNKMDYAVTTQLTNPLRFAQTVGQIKRTNAAGAFENATRDSQYAYAILSHGSEAVGAYRKKVGIKAKECTAEALAEGRNVSTNEIDEKHEEVKRESDDDDANDDDNDNHEGGSLSDREENSAEEEKKLQTLAARLNNCEDISEKAELVVRQGDFKIDDKDTYYDEQMTLNTVSAAAQQNNIPCPRQDNVQWGNPLNPCTANLPPAADGTPIVTVNPHNDPNNAGQGNADYQCQNGTWIFKGGVCNRPCESSTPVTWGTGDHCGVPNVAAIAVGDSRAVSHSLDIGYTGSATLKCDGGVLTVESPVCDPVPVPPTPTGCTGGTKSWNSCTADVADMTQGETRGISNVTVGFGGTATARCENGTITLSNEICNQHCAATTVNWGEGCSASVDAFDHGGTASLAYSSNGRSGNVTATCVNGSFTLSNPVCTTNPCAGYVGAWKDTNGTLQGDTSSTCPAACVVPWSGDLLANGQSVTGYTAASAPNCEAIAETRTCNNGTLSGSASYGSCTATEPASCTTPWGTTVADGGSVTAYKPEIVSYTVNGEIGSYRCNSEVRSCSNGTLSGSASYPFGGCDCPLGQVCNGEPGTSGDTGGTTGGDTGGTTGGTTGGDTGGTTGGTTGGDTGGTTGGTTGGDTGGTTGGTTGGGLQYVIRPVSGCERVAMDLCSDMGGEVDSSYDCRMYRPGTESFLCSGGEPYCTYDCVLPQGSGSSSSGSTSSSSSGSTSCSLPWGGTLANGQSVTAYRTGVCGEGQETRTCNNGVLSGWYPFDTCGDPAGGGPTEGDSGGSGGSGGGEGE